MPLMSGLGQDGGITYSPDGRPAMAPRRVTEREEMIVAETMRKFSALQTFRNTFASHWEEVAELILPTSRNTFFYGNWNWPGQKKTDRQVDSTGMLALSRFGAILDSLLTPRNMQWHQLQPMGYGAWKQSREFGAMVQDDYIMKDRATKLWFERATHILFKHRYTATANFTAMNQQHFQQLGAFGTSGVFVDNLDPKYGRGVRYKAIPLGELFITENHQGMVDGFIRWFRLTARQIKQRWPDTFPEVLAQPLEQDSQMLYDILHHVCPQEDYDPGRLDYRGMMFKSCYVSIQGHSLLSEGGYHSFPIATSRYDQTPQETYGRSPAMQVLPTLKTLNAQKRTFLKQGHRAADPVLLTADDGLVDFSMRPGALNKGGMSADGKPLVGILPTGSIQTSKEMMDEEKSIINDAFLVSLFQILLETPQMTATEVIERTNEKGILLAPSVGRQQSEYLGPLIDRELDVLNRAGLLPPQPPRLREAMGAYEAEYTGPLAKAMKAQEASGFLRTIENVRELVAVTQDPSLLDPFNFDVAVPKIAEINSVPASWMATDQEIADKRRNRAQAQAAQQRIQAMPAQAAMMKAQAVAQKAGGASPFAPAAPGAPVETAPGPTGG